MLNSQLKEYLKERYSKFLDEIELKTFIGEFSPLLKEVFISQRVFSNVKRILENDYFIKSYAENLSLLKFYIEIILKISAFSNYLTDIVVRNPEFLSRFLGSDELRTDFTDQNFENEIDSTINTFKTFNKKIDAIKRFKRLHTLRIGLRDILKLTDVETTMSEYSLLTRTILDRVFKLVINNFVQGEVVKKIPEYSLVSLGKLGGLELNFSSDVDLMCFYDDEENKPENLELFDAIVKKYIDVCTNPTNEGYLYRIDFRLRPDGKYAPLARTLNYYQIYYESYGRDWEKQMLLKMNFISGSKGLFEKFNRFVQSYIYHGAFFDSPKIFIKKFRNIYQSSLSENAFDKKMNLKHFSGGIRDVEFSVQALQLLYGKINIELRTTNTINALRKLAKNKLINEKESEKVIESYKFLRRIENFIQLMDDRQTHSLPTEDEKLQNLTRFLGMSNLNQFYGQLESSRKIIRNFYESIFEKDEISQINFERFVNPKKTKNVENIKKQYLNIIILGKDKTSSYDNEIIIKFQNEILNKLKTSNNPENFIKNLLRFISSISTKIQMKEFLTNKSLMDLAFLISELSDQLINTLISNQRFIDLYFSGSLFRKDIINLNCENLTDEDIKIFILQVMFNYLLKNLDSRDVNLYLTNFIDSVFDNLIQKISSEYKLDKESYSIIALGSYGTKEMHLKSDVDILFVFENEIDPVRAEKFSLNLLSNFKDKFKLFDYFQADSKLRPEGKASKLSWRIDEIDNYIKSRMRIWEFQSYTKMRLISGSEKIFNSILNSIHTKIKELDLHFIAFEIKKNKNLIRQSKIQSSKDLIDLKNSNGGLLDLQFMQQFLILTDQENFQNYTGKSFIDFCNDFSNRKKEFKKIFNRLSKNFEKIFSFILLNQIISGSKGHILNTNLDSKFVNDYLKIPQRKKPFDYFKSILEANNLLLKELNMEINK